MGHHPGQAAGECGEDAVEKFRSALTRHAAEQLRKEHGKERLRDMKNADNQRGEGRSKSLAQRAAGGLSH